MWDKRLDVRRMDCVSLSHLWELMVMDEWKILSGERGRTKLREEQLYPVCKHGPTFTESVFVRYACVRLREKAKRCLVLEKNTYFSIWLNPLILRDVSKKMKKLYSLLWIFNSSYLESKAMRIYKWLACAFSGFLWAIVELALPPHFSTILWWLNDEAVPATNSESLTAESTKNV